MPKKKEHTELVANGGQLTIQQKEIESRILSIRGQQVMLDRDLAILYGVETKRINEAVKRNIERFPEDFMFQLTKDEDLRSQFATLNEDFNLKSQIATSSSGYVSTSYDKDANLKPQIAASSWGGARKLPYAFTESGITMLSCVLRSETAIRVNVAIMRAFTAMRQFLNSNAPVFQRLETIEFNQLEMRQQLALSDKRHETNEQILSELLHRFDEGKAAPTQGIFFDGQIFDAHTFVCDLVRKAENRVVLIDNYVDDSVLKRLDKRADGMPTTIYTRAVSPQLQTDLNLHNGQYARINVITTPRVHDRFLIIDDRLYHVGASIKDLGKKIFAFSLMEESPDELLARLA